MISLRDKSSIHDRIWWPHMHALIKPRRYWIDDSLPWETNFQKPQYLLEHVNMQEGRHGRNGLPTYTFGMGDVKEENNHVTNIIYDRSSTLWLWKIDPYWKSQLLVGYSKDLFTCMILDDQLHEEGYSVQEGVIYYHDSIFLSRASKLKKKLLQRAYEEFLFSHTYSMKFYNIIMRSYTWKGFEGELYQHCQRCINHVELG